jgi:outer membrane lipoprotein-sorting protein
LRKLIYLIFTALSIPFFYSGCVPSKPVEDVEILPSERLINKLEVNRRRIKNFEGTGTFRVKSPERNNSASFQVTLQKPDSIFFSFLGPFGIELAQALVTDNNFMFYDQLHNVVYTGRTNDETLKDIFKINLSFSQLLDVFIGSVNLTQNLYVAPTRYEIDYDQYVLTYIDSLTNYKTEYHVDIRELGITSYKILDESNNLVLEGKYSQFELLENVAVPYKVEVENREQKQSVMIEYRNMQANKNNISINFTIPEDATIIRW